MRTHAAAAVILSISCALLTAACLQTPTPIPDADATGPSPSPAVGAEPIGEAAEAAYEDTFHFVDIKDREEVLETSVRSDEC